MVNGININSGYATTSSEGALGGGHMACGQAGMSAKQYGVDALGAIPNVFYKRAGGYDYNPEATYSCNPHWEGSNVTPGDLVDDKGEKVCYKLTSSDNKSITVYPVDTCNGNCSSTLVGKSGGCGHGSVSCMDIQDYSKQTSPSVRCPPVIYCDSGKILTDSEVQQKLKSAYDNNTVIKASPDSTGNEEVNIPPYVLKPAKGFCDWCSGKNMHFDIQMPTDGLSPWPTGQVVKYERIKCPN